MIFPGELYAFINQQPTATMSLAQLQHNCRTRTCCNTSNITGGVEGRKSVWNIPIVLAGGTTPRHVYASLRNADADWAAWHVYFGDEHCLPTDHVERNSWMATQAWMNHVAIPLTHIHLIPTEKDLQVAASAYAQALAGIMKTKISE